MNDATLTPVAPAPPGRPITVNDYWDELVTVALLGTDRRDPPTPPPGGLADLAADDPQPTASERLLQQVAGCATVLRAGFMPAEPVGSVDAAPFDPRPTTSPEVATTWRTIVSTWPVLEDEWLVAVAQYGWRLAPELVAPLLARHRGDATRYARVVIAAGPLAEWLVEQAPHLALRTKKPAVAELIGAVPELPITPELQPLLGGDSRSVASALADALEQRQLTVSHRAVLINLVARMNPSHLAPVAVALHRVNPGVLAVGLAYALVDLARLRGEMLSQLIPPLSPSVPTDPTDSE
jgi:hypothetical protein